jgi:hypothetical protein
MEASVAGGGGGDQTSLTGPHCHVQYSKQHIRVIYDVADLLIHHVKRQTGYILNGYI